MHGCLAHCLQTVMLERADCKPLGSFFLSLNSMHHGEEPGNHHSLKAATRLPGCAATGLWFITGQAGRSQGAAFRELSSLLSSVHDRSILFVCLLGFFGCCF